MIRQVETDTPFHRYEMNEWENTVRKRTFMCEEGKKEGMVFWKILLDQAPPFAHPPCGQHPTHTHPKQRPKTQCRPLSHTARHITNPFTCTSTHISFLYLAWCVNGKALNVGRHFFVCLFGVHASCPEFDLLKEEKKERKMKSESDEEGCWSMGMIGWFFCQWEAAKCLHPHSIAKVRDWLQSDK